MSIDTSQASPTELAIMNYIMDSDNKCLCFKDDRWTVISQDEIAVDFSRTVGLDERTELKKIGSASLCFDKSSLEKVDEAFERAVKSVYASTARGFVETVDVEDRCSKLLSQLNIFKRQITETPDMAQKDLLDKYKEQLANIETLKTLSTEEQQTLSDCKFMMSLIEKILSKKRKVSITALHALSKVSPSLAREALETTPCLATPLSEGDFSCRYPFLEEPPLPPRLHLQRFRGVNQYFDLNTFVQVKGDGNCFFYSVAAGVLNKLEQDPSYKETLMQKILKYQSCSDPYVLSATAKKEEDYIYVLENLDKQTPATLFSDEKFNEAFARILRYILIVKNTEGVDKRCDIDTDMGAVGAVNILFQLSAKVAVIEGAEYLDDNCPSKFVLAESMIDQKVVSIPASAEETPDRADFIIFRTTGHFFCGYHKAREDVVTAATSKASCADLQ